MRTRKEIQDKINKIEEDILSGDAYDCNHRVFRLALKWVMEDE